MAKPIRPTPELEGEDAIEFLEWMEEPPTEKDKEFWKEVYSQRSLFSTNGFILNHERWGVKYG